MVAKAMDISTQQVVFQTSFREKILKFLSTLKWLEIIFLQTGGCKSFLIQLSLKNNRNQSWNILKFNPHECVATVKILQQKRFNVIALYNPVMGIALTLSTIAFCILIDRKAYRANEKEAFANRNIDFDLYVYQADNLSESNNHNSVHKNCKALFGLSQNLHHSIKVRRTYLARDAKSTQLKKCSACSMKQFFEAFSTILANIDIR